MPLWLSFLTSPLSFLYPYHHLKKWGADHVINHRKDLGEQLKAIGYNGVDYILNCVDPKENFETLPPIINPFGGIVCIVHTDNLKVGDLFRKVSTRTSNNK